MGKASSMSVIPADCDGQLLRPHLLLTDVLSTVLSSHRIFLNHRKLQPSRLAAVVFCVCWMTAGGWRSEAQTISATVPVGNWPSAIAVNATSNKIYVTNGCGSTALLSCSPPSTRGSVTVIDGLTNTSTMINVGNFPVDVAVNPATNKVYVANYYSQNVTVIDGTSNSTASVTVGFLPIAIAVNSVTNKIYVANFGSGTVTVIDGATNSTTTISVSINPDAVAVNAASNKAYVVGEGTSPDFDGTVTIIDGATNNTTSVSGGSGNHSEIAINSITNNIYVANRAKDSLIVIDGATNVTTTIATGKNPWAVAVNSATNKIYVANNDGSYLPTGTVTIIDGSTNSASTVAAGTNPWDIAVNPVTNTIYVPNNYDSGGYDGTGNVFVIDGVTNNTSAFNAGNGPERVAINSATNKIYVANFWDSSITVIDGIETTTLGGLAVLKAVKLKDGRYGLGGKGFDYSGLGYLTVVGEHPELLNPSSQNPCETQGLSPSILVAPCWIIPDAISDQTIGYVYYASNTGNPAPSGGSANATDCAGLGITPCFDLKDYSESPAGRLHYDFGLDCSGLIMWSYNTAAGATTQQPDSKQLPIWYEGAGAAGDVIRSIVRASNVVTVSTRAAHLLAQGNTVMIEGVTGTDFDGRFTVTSTPSPTQFTYTQVGSNASSSWGLVTKLISGKSYLQGQCSDEQSILVTNNLGDINQASTYESSNSILPGDLMCFRYYKNGKAVSGHVAMFEGNGSTVEALSRTYNVIPGRVDSTGNGASLGRALRDPAGVMNCLLPHGTYCFDFLGYRRPRPAQVAIVFQAHSPISLSVTAPDGSTIDSNSWVVTEHEAYRAAGSLSYYDYSPSGDDTVFSATLETGSYTIRPVPKPRATADATYSLTATVGSNTVTLAQDVPIRQIPPLGYGIESTTTAIVPFKPVGIEIEPRREHWAQINLGSEQRTVPVAILSDSTFNAQLQADRSSLTFGRTGSEQSLASCRPDEHGTESDHRDSSEEAMSGRHQTRLVCKFYVSKTGFQPGDTVGVLKGRTIAGAVFRGSDAILVTNRSGYGRRH